MADAEGTKSPLEELQDTLSRLKEMEHYSHTNIEKLSTLWLEVSEHRSPPPLNTLTTRPVLS